MDVYNKFNSKLVRRLPMNDAHFLADLTAKKLFFGNLRAEVDGQATSSDKASYFLSKAIQPSLEDPDDIDIGPFSRLLDVMEKYNDILKRLAAKIRMSLSKVNVSGESPEVSPSSSPEPDPDQDDIPDIGNLTIGLSYHRLLWQELNKNFGSASTVFVMAVGKQLGYFDYDITAGHEELAAQKSFELVNNTISCATNYSSKGSVSMMWERLLQGKGPRAGPEHQPAFEKARRALFVDYDKKKPTKLYQDYCDKEIALEQMKIELEDKCQEKYGDQWKVNYERRLKVSKEHIEFERAAAVVKPHLDAIEIWEHGPLVRNLNHMKQVLNDHAKEVRDYSGTLLKYYRVSLQPANWYQWFDPSQLDDGGRWTQINVDSKNDDDNQAALYVKLGGSVTTYKSLDKQSDVKISFKVRAVQINRPWLDLSVLNNKTYKIYGEDPGSWSTGELDANNKGSFPLLSTQMIVASDIKVTASTKMEKAAIADACSLFGVGSNSCETINNNSIELKGTQVIGYVCTLLPKFPH